MNILITFFILTAFNVVFSTVKSIITVRGSPLIAALVNAGYYAYYNLVILYTVANFPLWQKVAVTFLCNLVGVFLVKYIESKREKTKLWLVKMTIPAEASDFVKKRLKDKDISNTYYEFEKFTVFDCFCSNKQDTQAIVQLCKAFDGKMFASENKLDF